MMQMRTTFFSVTSLAMKLISICLTQKAKNHRKTELLLRQPDISHQGSIPQGNTNKTRTPPTISKKPHMKQVKNPRLTTIQPTKPLRMMILIPHPPVQILAFLHHLTVHPQVTQQMMCCLSCLQCQMSSLDLQPLNTGWLCVTQPRNSRKQGTRCTRRRRKPSLLQM